MIMRLTTSGACWATFLSFLLVFCSDEASATTDATECVLLPDSPSEISLLDVWAGVSSFHEGFSQQAYVTVAEAAWIEKEETAQLVLNEFVVAGPHEVAYDLLQACVHEHSD